MARPSKLTDKQWAEIGRRLAKGEGPSALAREYGVSKGAISARFSKRTETIKAVAKQVAEAEIAFEALPVSEQVSARSLADELKGISTHLAAAARYGSMTAHKLASIANVQAEQIDEAASLTENAAALQSVTAMTIAANKAAEIPLNLLAANKKVVEAVNAEQDKRDDDVTDIRARLESRISRLAAPGAAG